MPRWVKTEANTAEKERSGGSFFKNLGNDHAPLRRSLMIRGKETI